MKIIIGILFLALANQAFAQLRCITCENCAQIPANPQTQICSHDPPSIDTTTTISLPETSPTQPGGGPILTNPTQTVPTTTLPTVSTVPTNPTLPGLTSGTTTLPDGETTTPTTTVAPPITDDPNIPTFTPPAVGRRRRDVSNEDINQARAHFSCFAVRVPVGTQGATQVNRGCVANGGSDDQTCRRAGNILTNVNLPFCQICSQNECNTGAASGVFASIFLILGSFLIVAFKLF